MQRRGVKPLAMLHGATLPQTELEMIKKFKDDRCLYCYDPILVKKGGIFEPYCGHGMYHLLCCITMIEKGHTQCTCGKPLQQFDQEVLEAMADDQARADEDAGCIAGCINGYAQCQVDLLWGIVGVIEVLPKFTKDIYKAALEITEKSMSLSQD